jgi:hypothetical protein
MHLRRRMKNDLCAMVASSKKILLPEKWFRLRSATHGFILVYGFDYAQPSKKINLFLIVLERSRKHISFNAASGWLSAVETRSLEVQSPLAPNEK